jgi:ArsR family transcriptional regulator, arsenate/arsenite/antimonite-responsive transcriptional repressor
MEKVNLIFEALSSSARRRILSYLSATDLTAGEIAERFEMSKPALSKHLRILESAGLVKSDKQGQYVHYSLVRESLVNNLYDFMANFCPVAMPLKRESKAAAKNRKRKGD